MSLASNKLLKTIYTNENPNDKTTRLATVVSGNSSLGFTVQFYGEEQPTQKRYKKYRDLSIGIGDKIVMNKINGTYIITGRYQ